MTDKELIEDYSSYFGAMITYTILGIGMIICEIYNNPFPSWGVLMMALMYWYQWRLYTKKYNENQSHNQDA